VRKAKADPKMKYCEINFSKAIVGKKNVPDQSMISRCLPRFEELRPTDTMMDIKKQVYKRIAPCFR